MKNESVYMQALHRKLDVVLVQILRYNCSETTAFARIRPPAGLRPLPGCGFHLQTPSAPTIFFAPPPLDTVCRYVNARTTIGLSVTLKKFLRVVHSFILMGLALTLFMKFYFFIENFVPHFYDDYSSSPLSSVPPIAFVRLSSVCHCAVLLLCTASRHLVHSASAAAAPELQD